MPLCVDVPVCCPLSCSTVRSPAGKVTASSQGKQLREWCEFIRLYSHTEIATSRVTYVTSKGTVSHSVPPLCYVNTYQWWESAVIFKCI